MVRFSAIEQKVFNEGLDPGFLEKTGKIPDIGDVVKSAKEMREKHEQIRAYSKFKEGNGFSAGGTFQTFGRINTLILDELLAMHRDTCDCGKDTFLGQKGHKEWILEYIAKHGQAYDVRGKVVA